MLSSVLLCDYLFFFCFECMSNVLNRSNIYWIYNVDSYERHELRIWILWMRRNTILLLTYKCLYTFICVESWKSCRLEKAFAIKRTSMRQLCYFCFEYICNVLNRSSICWIHNVDSYQACKLRICISWISKNVILLPTYSYVDTCIIVECKAFFVGKSLCNQALFYVTTSNFFILMHI